MRQELKDIQSLRQQSTLASDAKRTVDRLTEEVRRLEDSLSTTGSIRTADDVQEDLNAIKVHMCVPIPCIGHTN